MKPILMFIYYIKVVKTIFYIFFILFVWFFSFVQVEKEFETRGEYPPVPSIMFFYTDYVNKTIYTLTNIVLFPLEINVIHTFDCSVHTLRSLQQYWRLSTSFFRSTL